MPVYEFECPNCDNSSEVMKNISDNTETICDKCGEEMKKVISRCTFHLKGSGWYSTDYGKSSKK